ncbi:F0F1 ATP synthase subunit delta [Rubrivivax gelatinosus]|nr:F0F1 ATP synthase subunit delta [Rubrivivax gelatinosus]
MAELATVARPYAEALYQAAGADAAALAPQIDALAAVAGNAELRQFADHPKVPASQVYDVVAGVVGGELDQRAANLLRTVIENGRLAALPEVAVQFRVLVNASGGVSDATVYSAFPLDGAQLAEVTASLEKRFGRKLNTHVEVDPELIGGVRVVVGDEVLDTSVRARLEQMKAALTA